MPRGKEPKKIKSNKFIESLKSAIRKNKVKREIKKAGRKERRTQRMYKLKKHVDEFMKAAFEPKSAKTERKRKRKIQRKIQRQRIKELKTGHA